MIRDEDRANLRKNIRASVTGALAVAMACGPMTAAADGPLFLGQRYPAGDEPRSVIAADFDGDGDLDLAMSKWTQQHSHHPTQQRRRVVQVKKTPRRG